MFERTFVGARLETVMGMQEGNYREVPVCVDRDGTFSKSE